MRLGRWAWLCRFIGHNDNITEIDDADLESIVLNYEMKAHANFIVKVLHKRCSRCWKVMA